MKMLEKNRHSKKIYRAEKFTDKITQTCSRIRLKHREITFFKINMTKKIQRRNIHQANTREIQIPEKFTGKITQTSARISSKLREIHFSNSCSFLLRN